MASFTSWLWGTSQLDEAVDKATSELLPAGSEDIALNLEICDQIRSKSVSSRDAMRALKRRLNHKNPNVQNLALSLTDICVKNGGDQFLTEIASREFMDNIVSILHVPALNIEVKNNVLRLVQNWNFSFESKPALCYVAQVYESLLNEGFKFPPKDLATANAAMIDTQTAPEWIDSDVCLRCRNPFTFTNRKHHCRNCGQVFDQACSSKTMPLPHFGITQEVRVCDSCSLRITKKTERDRGHPRSPSASKFQRSSIHETVEQELQRALRLSLEDVSSQKGRPGYTPVQPSHWHHSEPAVVDPTSYSINRSSIPEEDSDLKAAIEASLQDMEAPRPSAPAAPISYQETCPTKSGNFTPALLHSAASMPSCDLDPLESDAILNFSQAIERVNTHGVQDVLRHPAVNEMYDKANCLRTKLASSLDDASKKEHMLSEMHNNLSQAVKLYDKLLAEQIAQPRWRSLPSEHVLNSGGGDGYSQWVTSAPAIPSTYQAQLLQWQQSSPLPPSQQDYSGSGHTPALAPPLVEPTRFFSSNRHQSRDLPSVSLPPQVLRDAQSKPSQLATSHHSATSLSPPVQESATVSTPNRAKTISFAVSLPPSATSNITPSVIQTTVPSKTDGHFKRSNSIASHPALAQQESWSSSRTLSEQRQHHDQQLRHHLMQVPAPPKNVIPEFPNVPSGVPLSTQSREEIKEALLIDL